MAGRTRIRTSYTRDANFLISLADAIERDPKRSLEWKQTSMGHLSALITLFMGAGHVKESTGS